MDKDATSHKKVVSMCDVLCVCSTKAPVTQERWLGFWLVAEKLLTEICIPLVSVSYVCPLPSHSAQDLGIFGVKNHLNNERTIGK